MVDGQEPGSSNGVEIGSRIVRDVHLCCLYSLEIAIGVKKC